MIKKEILDLSKLGLKNIEKLEIIANEHLIQEILMYENELRTIPNFSSFKSLKKLNLRSNFIKDIKGLNGLSNLVELNLSDNDVRSLESLKSLSNLTDLYLSNNNIDTIIGIEKLRKLKALYLGRNRLIEINPLKKLRKLLLLAIGSNKIYDFDVISKLKKIKFLIINNNQISDTTFLKKLRNLEFLVMSNNQISDIKAIKNLKKLRRIIASNNLIKEIPSLKKLKHLQLLDLSNNRINKIGEIQNCQSLKEISLNGNNIYEITDLIKLIKLKNIKRVNLDVNKFKLSNNKDISIFNNFFEMCFSSLREDYDRQKKYIENSTFLIKETKQIHLEEIIKLLDQMIGILSILINLKQYTMKNNSIIRRDLLFLMDERIAYEDKNTITYFNKLALKNLFLAGIENTYIRQLNYINKAISYFQNAWNKLSFVHYTIYSYLLNMLISISNHNYNQSNNLVDELINFYNSNKVDLSLDTSLNSILNEIANIHKNLVDYFNEPEHLRRLLKEISYQCNEIIRKQFPEFIFSNPILFRLIYKMIYDIKEISNDTFILDASTKKMWNKVYKEIESLNLGDFSKEILDKEIKLNEEIFLFLKNTFPKIQLHKKISGNIHIDISIGLIAVEVKKLYSNTKKDELIGQLKEDLRMGNYQYGIAFGIDMTKSKELLKFNRLYYEEGKIRFLIKENPYKI